MIRLLSLSLLLALRFKATQSQECTPEEIALELAAFSDPNVTNECIEIEYVSDNFCDVDIDNPDSSPCPLGTDCADCDFCMDFQEVCVDCIDNGCLYSIATGDCRSSEVVQVYGIAESFISESCPTCGDYTTSLDPILNTCTFSFDDVCDTSPPDATDDAFFFDFCPAASDCFDCDPCREFSLTSCEECTAQGCSWCSTDALCTAVNLGANDVTTVYGKMVGCTANNTAAVVDQCQALKADNPYNDPLYNAHNWIFEMINVLPVWEMGINGTGIGIRINDDGVDATHPDFADKFDVDSSCPLYMPLENDNSHGTACASLAAASSNDACSIGVAPAATISACNIIGNISTIDELEMTTGAALFGYMDNMHISSNSYGISGCDYDDSFFGSRRRRLQECPFLPGSEPCMACDWASVENTDIVECIFSIIDYCADGFNYENDVAGCGLFLDLYADCAFVGNYEDNEVILRGITQGRDGKGIIYLFAAGNEFNVGDNTNFQGNQINTRYTITVGAVAKDGMHTTYSTPGESVFVVAPGGDDESFFNNPVAFPGGGCSDATVGTSFSCPTAAGVTALIIEANPKLSWRDVQGVIAKTATKTDVDDPSWVTNGAGYSHSVYYGFGIINALAAVEAAKEWDLFPPEKMLSATSGMINLPLPEYTPESDPVESEIMVEVEGGFFVETVNVFLQLEHSSRGHLRILLTSPSGTTSVLTPGSTPENTMETQRWKLVALKNWGESPVGAWKISLEDEREGDVSNCEDDEYTYELVDEVFGNVTLGCGDFADYCLGTDDGFFIVTDPNDPFFTGLEGTTVGEACCACGGGSPPAQNQINDVLKEWTIAIYGHEVSNDTIDDTPSPGETPETPTESPSDSPPSPTPPSPVDPTDTPTKEPSASSRHSILGAVLRWMLATVAVAVAW